ncbi:MAG: hypothetical protein ACRC24_05200 [Vibrionaceae bacterium]
MRQLNFQSSWLGCWQIITENCFLIILGLLMCGIGCDVERRSLPKAQKLRLGSLQGAQNYIIDSRAITIFVCA